jgi:FAD/FMN-containing dehydrogenase
VTSAAPPTGPPVPAATADALLQRLSTIVGAAHVLTDPDVTVGFGTDWTGAWSSHPLAVIRPASTAEVADALLACADAGVPVVPQGGNTGLVGGGVPHGDGTAVVLSTARLLDLAPVDVATQTVVAGAGVTLAALDRHARAAGFRYAVDLAARDTATVGGMIATNAGGLRVVGYGDTRRQVAGVEAVLADGRVLRRMEPLAKDNGGYDLSQLMTGSEGTLGVITAARLRLIAAPAQPPVVTLIGLPDVAAAVDLVARARRRGDLTGAEMIRAEGMRVVREVCGLPHPLAGEHPVYLLLETADLPALDADADAVVDDRMWDYRDRQAEAVAALGVPFKLDVCLPIARIPDFLAAMDALPSTQGREVHVYAHLGDGNLHINLVDVDDALGARLDAEVLTLVAKFGGSIAAEHGVGVHKRAWLHLSRSDAEIATMRAIKQAFDPQHVMNPGVLLP